MCGYCYFSLQKHRTEWLRAYRKALSVDICLFNNYAVDFKDQQYVEALLRDNVSW